jgi:hypothetical protein
MAELVEDLASYKKFTIIGPDMSRVRQDEAEILSAKIIER